MTRNRTLTKSPAPLPFICFVLLALAWAPSVFARSFLDPLFETGDTTRLTDPKDTSPLDALQREWLLTEILTLKFQIHEASRHRHAVEDACLALSDSDFHSLPDPMRRGIAAYTCALAEADSLPQRPLWESWAAGSRLEKDLALARGADLPKEEKWFGEGRLFSLLPPSMGQNYGKALVALETLRRLHPESGMVDFYLGWTYAQQGNQRKAEEAFARALDRNPPDPRTTWFLQADPLTRARAVSDGLDFGLLPQLFYSPSLGVGAGLLFYDDRIADTARSGRIRAYAATRGTFGSQLAYVDAHLLEGYRAEVGADLRYGIEDFYGLGIRSSADNDSPLTVFRTNLRLDVKAPFLDFFYLRLGWRFGEQRVKSVSGESYAAANLPQSGGADHNGPWAELGFDSRDSAFHPTRGALAYVRGYFPTEGLGSSPTFSEWTGEAEILFPISFAQGVSFRAMTAALSGNAPYAVYPSLGGTFELPGVRDYRFQDRSLGALTLEYGWRVFPSYRVIGFANVGSVANEWNQWLNGVQWGGGIALEAELSRWHSQWFRAEVGYFGNQVVFQAAGGRAL
jgi:tetratricopeptide (TPR) repeat protein